MHIAPTLVLQGMCLSRPFPHSLWLGHLPLGPFLTCFMLHPLIPTLTVDGAYIQYSTGHLSLPLIFGSCMHSLVLTLASLIVLVEHVLWTRDLRLILWMILGCLLVIFHPWCQARLRSSANIGWRRGQMNDRMSAGKLMSWAHDTQGSCWFVLRVWESLGLLILKI